MLEMNTKTYQCRHLFTDGHRCGSKSLRGEQFCYYHHTTRKPLPRQTTSPNTATFELAFPEDRAAIQSNIGEVLRRIATNTIDVRRAGLLLYGLQIASLNLPKTQPGRNPEDDPFDDAVEEIVDDPIHGPLAAPAEFIHPQDQRPETIVQKFLRELDEEEQAEQAKRIDLQATTAETPEEVETMAAPSSDRRPSRRVFGWKPRALAPRVRTHGKQSFAPAVVCPPSSAASRSRTHANVINRHPRRKEAETEGLRFPQIHPLESLTRYPRHG